MSIFVDTPARISRIKGALVPSFLIGGSQSVDPGRVLNEDGSYALNEDGSYILLENPSYVLNEDGSYALDENGDRILTEDSTPATGHATPLLNVSRDCLFVDVVAKPTNYGAIWVSGPDAAEGIGVSLYARGASVHIPIDDVSKVYIWGNVGEGVTFIYGVTGTVPLRDDDGNIVHDDDGNIVTG